MASVDVQDILGMRRDNLQRPPAKKQKLTSRKPEHMTREVFDLIGERAPPVSIEPQQYKSRPKWSHPVIPWTQTPFTNPARKDGLVLRHWRKKENAQAAVLGAPATPADLKMDVDSDSRTTETEPDYHYSKFNIKVTSLEYNDEQYENLLKSDDWSKEETDYLMELVKGFDLRWIVITDRYDYEPKEQPSEGDLMAITVQPKARTMEDLKARYYEIAAKIMAFHHPLSSMSTTEFELHEKMTKYNPIQEATRKKLAEGLLSRTLEEIREEELLLSELKRIVTNEERFSQERKELYARLEAPQSTASIAQYESSQGLGQLMQTLLSLDKNKKRRSLMGPGDGTSSPATGSSNQNMAGQSRDQRNSLSSAGLKKGSMSGPLAPRQLTPREEAKFGVAHHDRLTSGVHFRSTRVEKLILAKSIAQSQKLGDALAELQVPHKAVMPTEKVCKEYERLIQQVHILLDVRKHNEKVENEIKILQAQKKQRDTGEVPDTPQSQAADADGDGENEEDAEDQREESRKHSDDEDEEDEDGGNDNDDGEGEDVDADADADADADGDAEADADDAEAEESRFRNTEPDDADSDAEEVEADIEVDVSVAEDGDGDADGEEDGNGDDDADADEDMDEPPEPIEASQLRASVTPSARSASAGAHKRSASVLSARSGGSTKRLKK